jgi:hypothetical protein
MGRRWEQHSLSIEGLLKRVKGIIHIVCEPHPLNWRSLMINRYQSYVQRGKRASNEREVPDAPCTGQAIEDTT